MIETIGRKKAFDEQMKRKKKKIKPPTPIQQTSLFNDRITIADKQ
jgi:hypothetical protein